MKESVFQKILHYIKNPLKVFIFFGNRGYLKWIPDKLYLKIQFLAHMGKRLHLQNPKTFNEKLQWLKLYDRNPLYTKLVDKYEVRDYVTKIIGEEYVIPLLGVWNRFEDIDFDKLPNQFVLKCTHDSGGLIICKDKNSLDKIKVKKKIVTSLKKNFFYVGREWPYKNVKPRIIAEKYMEDSNDNCLTDYKFFCFQGRPKIMYVSKDKAEYPTTDFFDMEYRHLNLRMQDPNSRTLPSKLQNFELMKLLATKMSKGFPHVRVDFFDVNGRVYMGEMTFYHCSGFAPIQPMEWDLKLGEWVKLNYIDCDKFS